MTQYDNTNRGILSKNTRKQKDTHPDHTGTLNIEGVEYFVDGWVKDRKDGSGKFLSLSVKRKEQQQPQQHAPQRQQSRDDSDEIPF